MAAQKGRSFQIYLTNVSPNAAVAGVQTKTVTWNGEPIDITNDDDSGYRTLLSSAGMESLDISFEGVTKDDTLRSLALNSGGTNQYTYFKLVFADGDTITGTFNLTNYEETGAHNDAVKFSATLQSSGSWTPTIS